MSHPSLLSGRRKVTKKKGKYVSTFTMNNYRGRIGEISFAPSSSGGVVEWKISDSWHLMKERPDCYYLSPGFSVNDTRWCLGIYPNGTMTSGSQGHVDLLLIKCSYRPSVSVEICFSLGNCTHATESPQRSTKIFLDKFNYYHHHFYQIISRSELQELFLRYPETILSVECTIKRWTPAGIERRLSGTCCSGRVSPVSCAFAFNVEENWKCGRCTLLNPANVSNCEACLFSKSAEDKYLEDRQTVVSAVENSDKSLCIICLSKERAIAFQPCWHVIACRDCADRLTCCAICRKAITWRQRIFLN